jgi:crossover junction endonuclease EME1
VGLGANAGLISSDLFDVYTLTDDFLDKPAKKRPASDEKRSPLRQNTVAQGPRRSDPSLFSFSDDDFSLPPSNPRAQKKYRGRDVDESDPIVFTSSAPEASKNQPSGWSKTNHTQAEVITLDDDDDDIRKPMGNGGSSRGKQEEIQEFSDPFGYAEFEDSFDLSGPGVSASMSGFSSKTAALLSALNTAPKGSGKQFNTKSGSCFQKGKGSTMDATLIGEFSDEVDGLAKPRQPAKKSGKLTTEEKEARAKARADAKAQRDLERQLERQLEKERKQKLKEEKAKEKRLASDIAEVNKLKVDKKDSTGEMILDISSSFEGSSVGNQAVEFMKRLKVEYHFFTSPIPNVIKWRRKMNARFNEDAGHWEPAAFHILDEEHVLCLVPAQDFVDMVIDPSPGEERESLEMHVLKIKSAYPGCTIIYLIEGLTSWMRKNSSTRNRAYVAEVLAQYEPEPPSSQASAAPRRGRKSKRKPETTPPVDDDTIEDALLALQVTHSCLIHHTAAPPESAEWIKNFTEHVSTIPYRRERMEAHDAAFCMENGQVKPGDDKLDTFVKMLQEVNRVTTSMAYGISSQYSCVTDLVRGMQMHGPTMLEDVKVRSNFVNPHQHYSRNSSVL